MGAFGLQPLQGLACMWGSHNISGSGMASGNLPYAALHAGGLAVPAAAMRSRVPLITTHSIVVPGGAVRGAADMSRRCLEGGICDDGGCGGGACGGAGRRAGMGGGCGTGGLGCVTTASARRQRILQAMRWSWDSYRCGHLGGVERAGLWVASMPHPLDGPLPCDACGPGLLLRAPSTQCSV
eukprot:363611-Chlamydomonas_euryale.AAC.2